jgi:hypothetical protein
MVSLLWTPLLSLGSPHPEEEMNDLERYVLVARPICVFDTIKTSAPLDAAAMAALSPAPPPPMTSTSQTVFSAELTDILSSRVLCEQMVNGL